MAKLVSLKAMEALDSRGNPTVMAIASTARHTSTAIVPSGASTGDYEAHELRDAEKRYLGKGVKKACANIRAIEKQLIGKDVCNQEKIDKLMLELDGTPDKSRLGANAILAVSMAVSRLAAKQKGMELFSYLAAIASTKPSMPIPFCNIINGGKHAGNDLAIQEFMVVPDKAGSFSEAARLASETYHTLKGIIKSKYGPNAVNVGDEGGFAPPISTAEQALNLMQKAVNSLGYNKKISFAIDVAASELLKEGKVYQLHRKYRHESLIGYYLELLKSYNIISIEDPFDQDDFNAFSELSSRLVKKAQTRQIKVVGDDLLVTNPERIKLAIQKSLCNALLLKINQIGTITEAITAFKLAKSSGWSVMVSHRSGETEDSFIADLAVGLGAGAIKIGAPCRGERTCKFNRLLYIENIIKKGKRMQFGKW